MFLEAIQRKKRRPTRASFPGRCRCSAGSTGWSSRSRSPSWWARTARASRPCWRGWRPGCRPRRPAAPTSSRTGAWRSPARFAAHLSLSPAAIARAPSCSCGPRTCSASSIGSGAPMTELKELEGPLRPEPGEGRIRPQAGQGRRLRPTRRARRPLRRRSRRPLPRRDLPQPAGKAPGGGGPLLPRRTRSAALTLARADPHVAPEAGGGRRQPADHLHPLADPDGLPGRRDSGLRERPAHADEVGRPRPRAP